MKKIITALALVVGVVSLGAAAPVQAQTSGNSDVCDPLDSGKIDTSGDPLTVTVTAPDGKLIDRYCVKAGSDVSVEDGAVQYFDVDPPQEEITFGHPSGKDVSHYSVRYVDKPGDDTTTTTSTEVTTTTSEVTTTTSEVTTTTSEVTTTTSPPTLPETGSDTTVIAILAALMTALGGAAIFAARRRSAFD